MIISLLLDKSPKAYKFLQQMQERADLLPLAPFKLSIKKYRLIGSDSLLAVLLLEITFLKFYVVGLLMIIGGLLINTAGLVWAGLLVSAGVLFFIPQFYQIMLFFGLRKSGYKGKIKYLLSASALQRLVENGTV